jgi:predicted phosphodiesterase
MTATEIVIEYCTEFPDVQTLTLAKKLYKDYPDFFKNLEDCRGKIRYRRGTHGAQHRKDAKDNIIPFTPRLPKSHAESFEPFEVKYSKILIISDLHFPYQDNKAIELALKYGEKNKMDCILINGDLFDFATISRHEKDWRHRSLVDEIDAVKEFFEYLQHRFPNVKIVFKEGNHDERFDKWLFHKSPEFFNVSGLTLKDVLKLTEKGIDYVCDRLPVKIGKLLVLHGHELNGGGGVNPARATFTKTIANVVIGHCHRSSENFEPTFQGESITTTSTGCLCGLHPMFARINKWNLGFAFVDHDIKSGDYKLDNLKIIKGKVV